MILDPRPGWATKSSMSVIDLTYCGKTLTGMDNSVGPNRLTFLTFGLMAPTFTLKENNANS